MFTVPSVEMARILNSKKSDSQIVDQNGNSSLLIASRNGQLESITKLLDRGFDINLQNKRADSALHLATRNGHRGVVLKLIDKGISINMKNKNGNTAAHDAAYCGHIDIITALLASGINMSILNKMGWTAFDLSCLTNNVDIAYTFIPYISGTPIPTPTSTSILALMVLWRCHPNDERVLHLLENFHIKVDTKDWKNYDTYLLHSVALFGFNKAVSGLVDAGVDINCKDDSHMTVLWKVCSRGDASMAQLLLSLAADIPPLDFNSKDQSTIIPTSRSFIIRSIAIRQILLSTYIQRKKLNKYASIGDKKSLEKLAKMSTRLLSAKDSQGLSPLHCAIIHHQRQAVQLLLGRGVSVNILTKDFDSPLHLACRYGCSGSLLNLILCQPKLDVNIENKNGFRPLHEAILIANTELVIVLMNRGASIDAETKMHDTALSLAIAKGPSCTSILELLHRKDVMDKVSNSKEAVVPSSLFITSVISNTFQIPSRSPQSLLNTPQESESLSRELDLLIISNRLDTVGNLGGNGSFLRRPASYRQFLLIQQSKSAQTCSPNSPINSPMNYSKSSRSGTLGSGLIANTFIHSNNNLEGCDEVLGRFPKTLPDSNSSQNNDIITSTVTSAMREEIREIAWLIAEQGIRLDYANKFGCTALHIAAYLGDENLTTLLLSQKADICTCIEDGRNALHVACSEGHHQIVQLLLKINPNLVTTRSAEDATALHYSCSNVNISVLNTVLACFRTTSLMSQIDATTAIGDTALHWASYFGLDNHVSRLVEVGADIYMKDINGNTPLHIACCYGHIYVVKILLQARSNIVETNNVGLMPLDVTADPEIRELLLPYFTSQINPQVCEDIITGSDTMASILVPGNNRKALHDAVENGLLDVTLELINLGHDVNATDQSGKTPLHCACLNENLEIVELLLQKDANPNVEDSDLNTPLHLACKAGFVSIIQALLTHHADVNIRDRKGFLPIHWALFYSNLAAARMIAERMVDMRDPNFLKNRLLLILIRNLSNFKLIINTHFLLKIYEKDIDSIKSLLDQPLITNRPDINTQSVSGVTALQLACYLENKVCVDLLLDRGAITNMTDNHGISPLHWATYHKNETLVSRLIESDADVNAQDILGRSPCHWACCRGHLGVTLILVEAGGDVNLCDFGGNSPLHYACLDTPIELPHSPDIQNIISNRTKQTISSISRTSSSKTNNLLNNNNKLSNVESIIITATEEQKFIKAIKDKGNSLLVRLLLSKGGDIYLQNNQLKTPFDMTSSLVIRQILSSASIPKEKVVSLAFTGDYSGVKCLLDEMPLLIKSRNSDGYKALHWAAGNGQIEIVNLLLDRGATINAQTIIGRYTALHLAVIKNYTQIVLLLINHGVDLDIQDSNGNTCLHWAICKGWIEIIKILIIKGADITICNRWNYTIFNVLSLAGHSNYETIARLLPPLPPAHRRLDSPYIKISPANRFMNLLRSPVQSGSENIVLNTTNLNFVLQLSPVDEKCNGPSDQSKNNTSSDLLHGNQPFLSRHKRLNIITSTDDGPIAGLESICLKPSSPALGSPGSVESIVEMKNRAAQQKQQQQQPNTAISSKLITSKNIQDTMTYARSPDPIHSIRQVDNIALLLNESTQRNDRFPISLQPTSNISDKLINEEHMSIQDISSGTSTSQNIIPVTSDTSLSQYGKSTSSTWTCSIKNQVLQPVVGRSTSGKEGRIQSNTSSNVLIEIETDEVSVDKLHQDNDVDIHSFNPSEWELRWEYSSPNSKLGNKSVFIFDNDSIINNSSNNIVLDNSLQMSLFTPESLVDTLSNEVSPEYINKSSELSRQDIIEDSFSPSQVLQSPMISISSSTNEQITPNSISSSSPSSPLKQNLHECIYIPQRILSSQNNIVYNKEILDIQMNDNILVTLPKVEDNLVLSPSNRSIFESIYSSSNLSTMKNLNESAISSSSFQSSSFPSLKPLQNFKSIISKKLDIINDNIYLTDDKREDSPDMEEVYRNIPSTQAILEDKLNISNSFSENISRTTPSPSFQISNLSGIPFGINGRESLIKTMSKNKPASASDLFYSEHLRYSETLHTTMTGIDNSNINQNNSMSLYNNVHSSSISTNDNINIKHDILVNTNYNTSSEMDILKDKPRHKRTSFSPKDGLSHLTERRILSSPEMTRFVPIVAVTPGKESEKLRNDIPTVVNHYFRKQQNMIGPLNLLSIQSITNQIEGNISSSSSQSIISSDLKLKDNNDISLVTTEYDDNIPNNTTLDKSMARTRKLEDDTKLSPLDLNNIRLIDQKFETLNITSLDSEPKLFSADYNYKPALPISAPPSTGTSTGTSTGSGSDHGNDILTEEMTASNTISHVDKLTSSSEEKPSINNNTNKSSLSILIKNDENNLTSTTSVSESSCGVSAIAAKFNKMPSIYSPPRKSDIAIPVIKSPMSSRLSAIAAKFSSDNSVSPPVAGPSSLSSMNIVVASEGVSAIAAKFNKMAPMTPPPRQSLPRAASYSSKVTMPTVPIAVATSSTKSSEKQSLSSVLSSNTSTTASSATASTSTSTSISSTNTSLDVDQFQFQGVGTIAAKFNRDSGGGTSSTSGVEKLRARMSSPTTKSITASSGLHKCNSVNSIAGKSSSKIVIPATNQYRQSQPVLQALQSGSGITSNSVGTSTASTSSISTYRTNETNLRLKTPERSNPEVSSPFPILGKNTSLLRSYQSAPNTPILSKAIPILPQSPPSSHIPITRSNSVPSSQVELSTEVRSRIREQQAEWKRREQTQMESNKAREKANLKKSETQGMTNRQWTRF